MSDYAKITNYLAKDSLTEGDPNKIIKGSEIDAEFVAIQNSIETKADLQSPVLTGVPRAPTAAQGTNTTQVATTAFVQANGIPIGGIIMWSGLIANIPSNYALCNGSNGTPDLRDKFIIGAGTTYEPSDTGGSASLELLEANLPAHYHALTGSTSSAGSHTHTVTDPGHTHQTTIPLGNYSSDSSEGNDAGMNFGSKSYTSASTTTNITIGNSVSHTHELTGSTSSVGSGTPVDILPPYMALAFIMRTA